MCRDDGKLRGRSEASTDSRRAEEDLLDRPIADIAPNLLEELTDSLGEVCDASFPGREIGAYRLLGVLGRGGMGVVYEAERADAQFEKRVAVKFMPRGLETPEMERRFRIERQILADLDHPAIARLLDGGVTNEGFPYLVMELVEGRDIDRFCREEKLSLKARLRLFLKVCAAVQFAHQKLVVHRDLKPGNILVTREGIPKLLDFGVAKLLEEDDANRTLFQPNTPWYASPEQIANRPVSTASDVYSLGVILFELLTDTKPYSIKGRTAGEIEAVAARRETGAPSVVVAEDEGHGLTAADRRRLARRLEGDLDNIVLKALRKEPERRFGSAEALAEDISRYLAGLPVGARPSTLRYRSGKFIGRHRLSVTTAAVVVLLLAIGVGSIVHQGRVARQERDRAEQVAGFVMEMMRISDPDQGEGTTITARELLEASRLRAEAELAGQPGMQARVLGVIAEGFQNLGIYDQAAEVLGLVVGLLEPQLPDSAGRLAENERQLGTALANSGRPDEGFTHFERAIALRRAHFPAPDPVVASVLVDFATAMGYNLPTSDPRRQRIESMLRDAIAISREANSGDSPDLASALHLLALELNTQSLSGAAIDEALAAQGERSMREALSMRGRLFGARSVEVAETLNDLSLLIDNLGRTAEGGDLMAEALDIHREALGPEHPDSIKMLANLGAFRFDEGRYEEAGALFRDCLVQWRKIYPVDDLEMAPAIYWLARTLLARGDLDGAETQLHRVIPLFEKETAVSRINAAYSTLGEVYLERGEYARAEPLLLSSFVALEGLRGAIHPLTRQARARVVRLFESTGRFAEADRYRDPAPAGGSGEGWDTNVREGDINDRN